MNLIRARQFSRRDDRGALLIIALLIITVVAVVTGVVLTRGDGSFRATIALRDVARTSYTADAAAQTAINALRTGYDSFAPGTPRYFTNEEGAGCFGSRGTSGAYTAQENSLYLNGLIPEEAEGTQQEMSARVECEVDAETGAQGPQVIINSRNRPGFAIVALGDRNTQTGGTVTASELLRVRGGIYANGSISGPVSVEEGADVTARGSCDQTVVLGGSKTCRPSVAAIDDPPFIDELGGVVPEFRKPPTTCTSGVATFEPGYYDSAAAMNEAMNLCRVMWFKPGPYYFDFRDETCTNFCPDGIYTGTTNVWTIPRGKDVLGGTPWNPVTKRQLALPPSPLPSNGDGLIPGNCRSPIDDPTPNLGVQFVFGANSRLYLDGNGSTGARMELCGSYNLRRPPILLYGLKTGDNLSATPDLGRDISHGGAVVSTGAFTGASVNSLKVGGAGATWRTTSGSASSTTLRVNGFTPTASVKPGTIVTEATLKVTHKEPQTGTNFAGSVKLTVGSWSVTAPVTATTTATTTSIPITGANLTGLQNAVRDSGYVGATIEYTANARANNATTTVGPFVFDLKYSSPVLRGSQGTCVETGSTCPILSTDSSGNNKINMYLQGTTYAPYGIVKIVLSNFSAEVAKFGVIARQVSFSVNTGRPRFTGPVFQIPRETLAFGTDTTLVRLKVFVCPGSSCASGGEEALSAKVKIYDDHDDDGDDDDDDGDNDDGLSAGDRKITVLSWSHTR